MRHRGVDKDQLAVRGRRAGWRQKEEGEQWKVYEGARGEHSGRSGQFFWWGFRKSCLWKSDLGGTCLDRLDI